MFPFLLLMITIPTSYSLLLVGEVVETFERDGTAVAKISTPPLHLEVPLEALDGAHLGDRVNLGVEISIKTIIPSSNVHDDDSIVTSLP